MIKHEKQPFENCEINIRKQKTLSDTYRIHKSI